MIKNIALIENNVLATNTIRKGLTEALIEKGFNITVLTTGTEEELTLSRKRGIKIIDVKSSNEDPRDIFKYVRNLNSALKHIHCDLCLTFTIRPNIWGNLVACRLGIPVISNITGIGPLFDNSSVAYKLARILYKIALKKTKIVFFQNEDDKAVFQQNHFVKPEVVRIIPGSGVDTSYFSPYEKIPDGKFTFLFVGRLIRDKGISEFIHAAIEVKQKVSNSEFKILGPLWNQNLKSNIISREELESWTREGYVIYEGITTDVRPFIGNADCVVIPSYREGMSNVLLEAGSMEKPCIASRVPGCNEIIEDQKTGLLCNPRDAADLALKMIEMISMKEEQRSTMGKNAREKIRHQFEKSIVVNAYIRKINEISKPDFK